MKILLDTNIFIHREDNKELSDELSDLLLLLQKNKCELILHPLSIKELEGDSNEARRDIVLSKVKSYPTIEDPPTIDDDQEFQDLVGPFNNQHDINDATIIYSVYRNAVTFLITEDRKLLSKAQKVGLEERCFSVNGALRYFKDYFKDVSFTLPPAFEEKYVYNLDYKDPILDKLRVSYNPVEFRKWWEKICRQGRKCFVSYNPDGTLGALMIYKEEDEAIESTPPLPKKKRIKLATMIVTNTGNKIGEFFIKKVIEIAMQKGLDEVYLTHFDEEDDLLIPLIESFGFKKVAVKDTYGAEESIYMKRLHFPPGETFEHPFDVSYCCYPSFYDGVNVRKFVIPIQGPFHERIFTDQTRQAGLFEFAGEHVVAGNTMKKAYLCHAKIKTMKQGDIVIFYRSQDKQEILTLGVIESVHQGMFTPEEVVKLVGKRTVYSREEIDEMSLKQLTIILFRHHFHFKNPLSLNDLKKLRVLAGPPQSIMEIDQEKYLIIKKEGYIDESYTVN